MPVDPFGETWRRAFSPRWLPFGCPGVTQVHVLVNMDFVDIDDPYLTLKHALVERLELFDFGQQLFALLPAQTGLRQDGAECVSADRSADLFFYPSS